jgi:hypothetical protein
LLGQARQGHRLDQTMSDHDIPDIGFGQTQQAKVEPAAGLEGTPATEEELFGSDSDASETAAAGEMAKVTAKEEVAGVGKEADEAGGSGAATDLGDDEDAPDNFKIQMPMFDHDTKESEGLPCFCQHNGELCKFEGKSWFKLMSHVRQFHKINTNNFKGTHFHDKAHEQSNAAYRALYAKKHGKDQPAIVKAALKKAQANTATGKKGHQGPPVPAIANVVQQLPDDTPLKELSAASARAYPTIPSLHHPGKHYIVKPCFVLADRETGRVERPLVALKVYHQWPSTSGSGCKSGGADGAGKPEEKEEGEKEKKDKGGKEKKEKSDKKEKKDKADNGTTEKGDKKYKKDKDGRKESKGKDDKKDKKSHGDTEGHKGVGDNGDTQGGSEGAAGSGGQGQKRKLWQDVAEHDAEVEMQILNALEEDAAIQAAQGMEMAEYGTDIEAASNAAESAQKDPLQMIADMHRYQTMQQDRQRWKQAVPEVWVKRTFLEAKVVSKRGQDGCSRGQYPTELKGDLVKLPAFEAWLEDQKAEKGTHLSGNITHARAAGRALGALGVGRDVNGAEVEMSDVKVLVGLYLGGQITTLLSASCLHTSHYWTGDTMSGFTRYIQYNIQLCKDADLAGADDGVSDKYKKALERLEEKLDGGVAQKCREDRVLSFRMKQQTDNASLKILPDNARRQAAVQNGYVVLQLLVKKYKDSKEPFPEKARSLANQIVVQAIAYDTFAGRKWEWENLLWEYMLTVLTNMQKFIRCQHHKTAPHYGEVVKLLTPGLLMCLLCYSELPRPKDCKYFFVPCKGGANTIGFVKTLRTANANFMPECKPPTFAEPLFNLMRKLFHQTLMKLTRDEAKLKKFIAHLDKHSVEVMERHYLYRDPEDDMRMSVLLVSEVFGETVPWPTLEDVQAYAEGGGDGGDPVEEFMKKMKQDSLPKATDADEEEEPEWWGLGGTFGVKKPLPALEYAVTEKPCIPIDDEQKQPEEPEEPQGSPPMVEAPACGPAARKQKVTYTAEQRERWADYTIAPFIPGMHKESPLPGAHTWMEAELKKWQDENGKGVTERPPNQEWYWEARCGCIDANLVTKMSSKDVVRSWLKSVCSKRIHQASQAALKKMKEDAINVGDGEAKEGTGDETEQGAVNAGCGEAEEGTGEETHCQDVD